MSIISGIYGPGFWHQAAHSVFPSALVVLPKSFSVIDYSVIGMTILLFTVHAPFSIVAVYKVCRTKERKTSFRKAILQIFPMTFFLLCNFFWLASKYSIALQEHCILFLLANGIVFGRMAVCFESKKIGLSCFQLLTLLPDLHFYMP
jgi:ethanolaminephosphotransferase